MTEKEMLHDEIVTWVNQINDIKTLKIIRAMVRRLAIDERGKDDNNGQNAV